jgi:radical SAM-linked protein
MTRLSVAQPDGPAGPASPRFRVAVEYAVRGDLRHLSHHDELRMLTRALMRAGWPVRFSQGFNPTPRLSIPLPRSVGMASACQWALIDLREPADPQTLCDRLAAALPRPCLLKQVIAPAPASTPHPLTAEYAVTLDSLAARSAEPRLRRLLALPQLIVQRNGSATQRSSSLDIRPYIESLTLDGPVLFMRLCCAQQRTARPSEILTELGLAADAAIHGVRRIGVTWDMELVGPAGQPTAPEGTELGRTEEVAQP